MVTHSTILDWRTLWTEEPGELQSREPQRQQSDQFNKSNFKIRDEVHIINLHEEENFKGKVIVFFYISDPERDDF